MKKALSHEKYIKIEVDNLKLCSLLLINVVKFLNKNRFHIEIGTAEDPDKERKERSVLVAEFYDDKIILLAQEDRHDNVIFEEETFHFSDYTSYPTEHGSISLAMLEALASKGFEVERDPDHKLFDSMGYHKEYLRQLLHDARYEVKEKDFGGLGGSYGSIEEVVKYLQDAEKINKLTESLKPIV